MDQVVRVSKISHIAGIGLLLLMFAHLSEPYNVRSLGSGLMPPSCRSVIQSYMSKYLSQSPVHGLFMQLPMYGNPSMCAELS